MPVVANHGMNVLHLMEIEYTLLLLKTWNFFRCHMYMMYIVVCVKIMLVHLNSSVCTVIIVIVLIKVDKTSSMWELYLNYVDEMVVDGLCKSIHCSLQYFLANTEKGGGRGPLLECKMELQAPEINFVPDLDQVKCHQFYNHSVSSVMNPQRTGG